MRPYGAIRQNGRNGFPRCNEAPQGRSGRRIGPGSRRAINTRRQPPMPRYMVERTFPDGLALPVSEEGEAAARGIVNANADLGVTWVHSYVSEDKNATFCIYDGPS